MSDSCYLDTSALAKWYINEPGSELFEAFIQTQSDAVISRLTATELRCLLARRRRTGDLGVDFERDAFASFERDITAGHLRVHPCGDALFVEAINLIERLEPYALRTLDALHLALALDAGTPVLATADKIMARAGAALGFEIAEF